MNRMAAGLLRGLMILVLAGQLATGGCSTAGRGGDVTQMPGGSMAAAGDYRIASGDVLEITVYGEEGLNKQELVVRPDGKVSFPLIGDVEAGGLTTVQVKDAVEQKVQEYIPGAVADVSVRQLGSLQYYVMGKVNKPGMYNVSKPISVLQALALAGGLTIFADESGISIVRSTAEGKVVNFPFNYKEVRKGRHLEQNIVLDRGDTVVVP